MDSDSSNSPSAPRQPEWAQIDASLKVPVLFLVYAAAAWLVTATVLGFIAAAQWVQPAFLADCAWTTHGRIVPMARNAFIYGWGFNAGFAVLIWMTARLSRVAAPKWGYILAGAFFWNAGLKLGLVGIMIGHGTGHFLLEMPGYSAALMFVAYAFLGASVAVLLSRRREGNLHAAQWYGLAALFWFPWLFTIGQATLVSGSIRGTGAAVASAWYGHNVFALFVAPVALGALYYLLPKRLGRPIAGYSMAKLGFWSYAVFASFGGLATLAGSPVPAWVQSLGIASNYMLLIPLFIIGINLVGTTGQAAGGSGPALRFLKLGALAFVLSTLLTILFSVPAIGGSTALTYVGEALRQFSWLGFATLALSGAIYFLLPRLTVRPWPSAALVAAHFWASVSGLIMVVGCLLLAGFAQGGAINDPEAYTTFSAIADSYTGYLVGVALGYLTLLVGQIAFLVNVVVAIYQAVFGRTETDAATLFPQPPALEVNS